VPIRIRLAIVFALATLTLVGTSGYLFVHSLRHGLETSLDAALRNRADALTQKVHDANGGIDFQDSGRTRLVQPEDSVAQVLDPAGRVVESSEAAGSRPLISPSNRRKAQSKPTFAAVSFNRERFRALSTSVRRSDGVWTVVVASSLESADEAISRVVSAFVAGGAIAVLLAGLGAWLLARAALRPVERMRREAADISEHDAASRLPVPTTRDEVASLASTMNELLARLQGALTRQTAFVADAGHELRTPLAVLRTELELAGHHHRSPEELLDAIRNAADETDRIARLAEELLFLARSDGDRDRAALEVEPLMPLLTRSVEMVETRAADADVTVSLRGDDGIAAPLHPDHFRRAVDNLLDNALRFAPRGTVVVVRASRDGPDVVVEVADDGPGFPPAFLPFAFERFRRSDDARSRTAGGSGLGLAIVLAVARDHGGTASAGNCPDGGAAVSIRIPATEM
jgi:two-component system, OmpR family, sensor kinase